MTKKEAIIVMDYTGIATVNFDYFYRDAENRLGQPIFSHEFSANNEELKEAYKDD